MGIVGTAERVVVPFGGLGCSGDLVMIGMGFGRCWPFGEFAPLWFGGSLQGLQVGVQPFLLARAICKFQCCSSYQIELYCGNEKENQLEFTCLRCSAICNVMF